jgi:hypothetical protein
MWDFIIEEYLGEPHKLGDDWLADLIAAPMEYMEWRNEHAYFPAGIGKSSVQILCGNKPEDRPAGVIGEHIRPKVRVIEIDDSMEKWMAAQGFVRRPKS